MEIKILKATSPSGKLTAKKYVHCYGLSTFFAEREKVLTKLLAEKAYREQSRTSKLKKRDVMGLFEAIGQCKTNRLQNFIKIFLRKMSV